MAAGEAHARPPAASSVWSPHGHQEQHLPNARIEPSVDTVWSKARVICVQCFTSPQRETLSFACVSSRYVVLCWAQCLICFALFFVCWHNGMGVMRTTQVTQLISFSTVSCPPKAEARLCSGPCFKSGEKSPPSSEKHTSKLLLFYTESHRGNIEHPGDYKT